MQLVFFTEARFIKNDKGDIYNAEGSLNYLLWERYLEHFDSIVIVARVKLDLTYRGNEHNISSGERVTYVELPYYVGPKDFLIHRRKIKSIIKKITVKGKAYLMRVPGTIGYLASLELKKKGIPYGVEVVGDPIDVFSKGSINHPLRSYFKYMGFKQLRYIVENSSAALYVTLHKLQKRYPVKEGIFTTSASNVILKKEYIAESPKVLVKKESYNLLCIGSLSQMYKAPDVVLKSVKHLKEKGLDCRLTWLGTGKYLEEVKKMAGELGIDKDVEFVGYVSDREEIMRCLDKSDIFILASRTEGLPRVIIEAMARGLPIIGSDVGGIPELVSPQLLVKKNDIIDLANKIIELASDLDFTNRVAEENLIKSHHYSEDSLNANRKKFYREIINIATR